MAHAPQRTCVACRQTEPKPELLRIVRGPEGQIRVDASGSASGRGAYVHPTPACVAAALDRGRIARALRTASSPDELCRLRNEIEEQMGAR